MALPLFPLYPSPTFLRYNVSLAIPGPFLWSLPVIGDYAKKSNYPNSAVAILIPDVEYIKRFANYELGISDAMLKAAQQENIARIKSPEVKKSFDGLFGVSSSKTGAFKDGMGLSSVEKTILASAFETQKPYFEIAQIVVKSIVKIEDIIARICPLLGAAINPAMALAIKSRKPKGNGPQQTGKILGPYGSPPALGYKSGQEVTKSLDKLTTELQRGDGVNIDKNGKYTKVSKKFSNENTKASDGPTIGDLNFTYVTISTVYSTGVFQSNTDYLYKYVDIGSDEKLPEFETPPEPPEPDLRPNRIILGIYKSDGTPLNPREKIRYWAPTSDGLDLEIQESIFERAPWIFGEKWILNKSIDYSNLVSWKTLELELYKWRRYGVIRTQLDNPNSDASPPWVKLKYRDVIDFNNEKYQYLKYKEDDTIVEFTQGTIGDYRRYYDFIVGNSMTKYKVPNEDRPEIMKQVEKLFSEEAPNDKILEQLQNLIKYGDFKNSYYSGVDNEDWKLITNSVPAPTDSVPNPVRKIFKPMRFRIDNQEVWIDPEDEYDLKVIRVDPTLKLSYTKQIQTSSNDSPSTAASNIKKNSDIRNFIKSKLKIVANYNGTPVNFSIKTYRTTLDSYSESAPQETLTNVESFDLNNWNVNIDNLTGTKQVDNRSIALKLYFDSNSSYPEGLTSLFNKEWANGSRYYPDSNYDDGSDPAINWATTSFSDSVRNIIELSERPGFEQNFNEIMDDIGLNLDINKFNNIKNNISWIVEQIDKFGNVDLSVEKVDKVEASELLYNYSSVTQFQNVVYTYRTKQVIKPLILANSIILLEGAIVSFLALKFVDAVDKFKESIDKFKEAVYDYKYYTRQVFSSAETTTTDQYKKYNGSGPGSWLLKLNSGIVKEFIFFKGVINQESVSSLGIVLNSLENLPQQLLNGITDRLLPKFGKDNIITFNLGNITILDLIQNFLNDIPKSLVSFTSTNLEKFQVSVFETNGRFSKLKTIKSSNYGVSSILNYKLQELGKINRNYSKGRYGAGWRGGPVKDENGNVVHNEPDNPQYVGYVRRGQLTELDIETYYIIEGYKKSENEKTENENEAGNGNAGNTGAGSGGGSGGGGGFYRMPAAVGIAKVMVELVIEISVKLFPAINKLIALLKNPASFVTEIIKAKLEDHFIIFNPRVTSLMSDISSMSLKVKNARDEDEKYYALKDMRKFVKGSELGNYIYVDDKADFKFLLDGPAVIGFFSLVFGLDLNLTKAFNGGVPIKPIFAEGLSNSFLDKFEKVDNSMFRKVNNLGDTFGQSDDKTQRDLKEKVISNLDITNPDKVDKNKIVSKNGKEEYYEEVSITYSTGKFIKGVDYKYIYLNQNIEKLIRDADNLINTPGTASNPLDALQEASEKYQQAYDMIDPNDKENDSLKKLLLDKIKDLKGKVNIVSNPLFKFILGIVTLPLKVIFSIIEWLIDFFKKLTNPIKFPGLMVEFLSFKWIMQFFTPKGLLEIAGIKFKPEKLVEWCVAVNVKNPLFGTISGVSEYLIPDDYIIADLNEFLSVGFEVRLPIYTAKQYRDLCLRPFRLFNVFFCLIEKLINSFIMLIWSVMGITAVIPPPLLKLCKRIPDPLDEDATPNMPIQDLRDLINGLYKDDDLNVADPKLTTEELQKEPTGGYDFIYEVKLPDGTTRKDLDRNAVQKLINKNKDLNFDFLNFETLE